MFAKLSNGCVGENCASNSKPTCHVCKNCGKFNGEIWKSKAGTYTPTFDPTVDRNAVNTPVLMSIVAMPILKDKSHEELRWEDHISLRGTISFLLYAFNLLDVQ